MTWSLARSSSPRTPRPCATSTYRRPLKECHRIFDAHPAHMRRAIPRKRGPPSKHLPPHEFFNFVGTPGLRSSVTYSLNTLPPVLPTPRSRLRGDPGVGGSLHLDYSRVPGPSGLGGGPESLAAILQRPPDPERAGSTHRGRRHGG